MCVLPSLHVYLSSLEALLSMSPKFLTSDAWGKLEVIASYLTMEYERIHHCVYTDSNGRATRAYLDSIRSRMVSGIDVPSPGGVRRQTLTPDVIATIQEPVDSPKPPTKARFHWPSWLSWLNFGSVRGKAESGEGICLDNLA
ncbi:hypothetical protein V8D89_013389 [Ganoderma adspersum]